MLPFSSSSSSSSSSDDAEIIAIGRMIQTRIRQFIRQLRLKNYRKFHENNRKASRNRFYDEYRNRVYSSHLFRRRFRWRQNAFQISQPYSSSSTNRLQVQPLIDSYFQKIQIHRDDTTFDAYVVGKDNAPGIVVLQEWWCVEYQVKNYAVKISQLEPGFKVLIPDLNRGKVALDMAEAHQLLMGLDWQGALKDIEASVNWLKANGSLKVGVTGHGRGGALAIASAVLVPGVDTVVSFYGIPSPAFTDSALAKVPVQVHFGEVDASAGFSFLKKDLEEKLKASSVASEVHVYTGSAYAFMNDVNDDNVHLAWSRFQSWMASYLT
ncbi:hypothetical protein KSS87_014067 [Heliosperma pusillum]|nr:hypothetical protein KSS87_014067 [Heliosperma pusillum]